MKALIFENKVIELAESEFPVHASMQWVDCDDTVEVGYAYDGEFTSPPEPVVDRAAEIKRELQEIDTKSIRPLRAKMAGTNTQADDDMLADLEADAATLRTELANL